MLAVFLPLRLNISHVDVYQDSLVRRHSAAACSFHLMVILGHDSMYVLRLLPKVRMVSCSH